MKIDELEKENTELRVMWNEAVGQKRVLESEI